MNKSYKIKLADNNKSTLSLHPKTADLLGISKMKMVILRFGCLRQFADVTLSNDIAEMEIQLSANLAANLHLPDFPDYELHASQNELEIGPFIGMLMSREGQRLTSSFLERMKIYVSEYDKLHGAVIVFALDKVDPVGRLVEGYCYNPVTQDFEKGVYPFPASMYRAIGLSEQWKNCFLSVIGDRLFNNYFFSKWKMYQWYSKHSDLSAKIPYTRLYKTDEDIFEMLGMYGKVFIKPVSGLGGHGITKVQFNNDVYEFKYRENGENCSEIKQGKEEASEYINLKFSQGRYLIQQPIELIQMKGCVVDFRCIMQKNQSGLWVCKAIIGRYGKQGSVVSNISSGGTAFTIDNMKIGSFPLPKSKIVHLGNAISAFALKACNALDKYGLNCGTLGIDVGVDIEGNLWLIEINNRDPDPTIALDIHDRPLYEKLKTGILYYAKFLSGFK